MQGRTETINKIYIKSIRPTTILAPKTATKFSAKNLEGHQKQFHYSDFIRSR